MEVLAIQLMIASVLFFFCLFGKGTVPVLIAVALTFSLVFAPWLMALQLLVIILSASFGSIIHGAFTGTLNGKPSEKPIQTENTHREEKTNYYDQAINEEKLSGKFSHSTLQCYEAAIAAGEAKAHYHVGLYSMNFGNYGKAKYHFHQSINLNDPRGYIGLGKLEYNRRHNWDAREYFNKAIEAGITEGYYHLGIIEDDSNSLKEAMVCYRKAVEHGHNEACTKLGVIYYLLKLKDKAKSAFMQAIANGDPEGHYYMGVFEYKARNLHVAKEYFLKAMDCRTIDASYYMALIHYELGEHKIAIEYLDKFSYLSDSRMSELREEIEKVNKVAS